MGAGYVCKRCGGPSPVGVGYVSTDRGAAALSAAVQVCGCGYSVAPTLGDDLGDGDAHAVEVGTRGGPVRWPFVRERFEVRPDGSVWSVMPGPGWRGPLVAIRCDGSEVS